MTASKSDGASNGRISLSLSVLPLKAPPTNLNPMKKEEWA
jgi:hypothetical protein